jgi:signal transduction histidine kinase
MELRGRKKDGELFPVEISLSPLRAGENGAAIAIVRDVTERRQAQGRMYAMQQAFSRELEEKNRELVERNQEVERANRLKSEFLASMSHELRSPLHTIIGFSDLLGEGLDGELTERQLRFVNHIREDSNHLLAIINDLLDISKIEAGRLEFRPEEFPLREAIEEAVSLVRAQVEAKDLELTLGIPSITVEADRLRFKQVLVNLLSNAVKFTARGGKISVRAANGPRKAAVSVADSGIGIAATDQAAVFETFYQASSTTKGVREGTGLGLAIAKKLVEQSGGDIWVESAPEQGSVFTFTIPLAHSLGGSGTIAAVFESHRGCAELLVDYIEPRGISALCVSSAETLMRLVAELDPRVLVVDLVRANDGKMLSKLREQHPRLPMIVATPGDHSPADLPGALFLVKPVSRRALIHGLDESLHSGWGTTNRGQRLDGEADHD